MKPRLFIKWVDFRNPAASGYLWACVLPDGREKTFGAVSIISVREAIRSVFKRLRRDEKKKACPGCGSPSPTGCACG